MKKAVVERQAEEQDYRAFERQQREADKERRQIYKDTLDHQLRLMDLQKHKYGTMTNEEKRMNKVDLHNYKANEGTHIEAMIPGIHNLNTVGSSPLKRGAT
jgi:hypothetical protein